MSGDEVAALVITAGFQRQGLVHLPFDPQLQHRFTGARPADAAQV